MDVHCLQGGPLLVRCKELLHCLPRTSRDHAKPLIQSLSRSLILLIVTVVSEKPKKDLSIPQKARVLDLT